MPGFAVVVEPRWNPEIGKGRQMATVLLGRRTVEAAEPKQARYDLFDEELKGFGLRVTPNGEKTYFVMYRPGDGGRRAPKRRLTLGRASTLTPDEARKAAQRHLAGVKLGADPTTAKATRRAMPSESCRGRNGPAFPSCTVSSNAPISGCGMSLVTTSRMFSVTVSQGSNRGS